MEKKNRNQIVKVVRPGGGHTFMPRKVAESRAVRRIGCTIVEDLMVDVPEVEVESETKRGPRRPRKTDSDAGNR